MRSKSLHRAYEMRKLYGFAGIFDTGLMQKLYRYDLNAPAKKRL